MDMFIMIRLLSTPGPKRHAIEREVILLNPGSVPNAGVSPGYSANRAYQSESEATDIAVDGFEKGSRRESPYTTREKTLYKF